MLWYQRVAGNVWPHVGEIGMPTVDFVSRRIVKRLLEALTPQERDRVERGVVLREAHVLWIGDPASYSNFSASRSHRSRAVRPRAAAADIACGRTPSAGARGRPGRPRTAVQR